jgi:hypothetical protein
VSVESRRSFVHRRQANSGEVPLIGSSLAGCDSDERSTLLGNGIPTVGWGPNGSKINKMSPQSVSIRAIRLAIAFPVLSPQIGSRDRPLKKLRWILLTPLPNA